MTRVMGVLNVTPDSFSDGGRYLAPDAALAQAQALIAQGAHILDIGAESTRPGAEPATAEQEIARAVPVIAAIRAGSDIPISIDTMKPDVARAAVAAGATIWNDVAALTYSPDAASVAAELGCEVILMHMRGEPRTMQQAPSYEDVVTEVADYLQQRAEVAIAAGVARNKIWIDPGIGFGKRLEHNLALLAHLDRFVALGFPVLLGVSRKSFIAAVHPPSKLAQDRVAGSLACAIAGAQAGVEAVRVHDVAETVQALAVHQAIVGARG